MRKKLNPRKCMTVVRAIHDVLYLEMDGKGQFYSGAKEWSLDVLETIASAVEMAIPRPAEPSIECALSATQSISNAPLTWTATNRAFVIHAGMNVSDDLKDNKYHRMIRKRKIQ